MSRTGSAPLLVVDDLRTTFATRGGLVRAVDGVSFEVQPSESLGIVGESGSGKSVTALSLLRLAAPGHTTGSVLFDGEDLLRVDAARLRAVRGGSVAMVFQDPMTSLNPVLTVGRQLTEGLEQHLGVTGARARSMATELLEQVGIPSAERRLRDFPHQFSGGMRQRVMIAMAISCRPRLVIADEVTTALDVTIQAQILELLRRLSAESGTSYLFITHDLGVVAGMTQRVQVMYAGQVVEQATTRELFRDPRMPYTWGLLRSVPRLGETRRRLVPIEGVPPNMAAPPSGCRFAPRCRFARAICRQKPPALLPIGPAADHEVRCWGAQSVDGGGWLVDLDWRTVMATVLGVPSIADTTTGADSDSLVQPEAAGVGDVA